MIYSSVEYKNQLKKDLKEIRQLFKDKYTLGSRGILKLERFLFFSAFIIRKLIESKKISDELEDEKFEFEYVDAKKGEHLEDYSIPRGDFSSYKIYSKRKKTDLTLKQFTNIFIHSYLFVYSIKNDSSFKDNTKNMELLVNSDYLKKKLYFVSIYDFIKICKKVCVDDIVSMEIGEKHPMQGYRSIIKKSRIIKNNE